MKKLTSYIIIAVLGIALAISNAAANEKEITAKSQGDRTDVFSEVKEEGIPPKGFADLVIKASIKTHLEGYYVFESKKSLHGKPGCPFVFNIDGQAAMWEVEGQVEDIPEYTEKGKRNPEGGKGMRYALIKRIRLAAGFHKIFFGLPGENRSKELAITTEEGKVYNLEFKPIYNRYRYMGQRFERGVDRIEVFLNGIPIQ